MERDLEAGQDEQEEEVEWRAQRSPALTEVRWMKLGDRASDTDTAKRAKFAQALVLEHPPVGAGSGSSVVMRNRVLWEHEWKQRCVDGVMHGLSIVLFE